MKNFILMCLAVVLSQTVMAQQATEAPAQKKTATAANTLQTDKFMVLGNCGMCKNTIEKAALGAGAATAAWDGKTDQLEVSFDAKKSSTDAIQKAVAKAGYDNAGYKAPDKAYKKLHACCQYDRTGAAGGTKTCTDHQ